MKLVSLYAIAVVLLCGASTTMAQIKVTPDNPSGVYKLGDKARWTLSKTDPADSSQYSFTLKRNGADLLKQGTLDFTDGKTTVEDEMTSSGALLLEVQPASQPHSRAWRILGRSDCRSRLHSPDADKIRAF